MTYTLALQAPQQDSQQDMPDWIVDIGRQEDNQYYSLTIDGTVSLFNKDHSKVYETRLTDMGDTAKCLLSLSWKEHRLVITGG